MFFLHHIRIVGEASVVFRVSDHNVLTGALDVIEYGLGQTGRFVGVALFRGRELR